MNWYNDLDEYFNSIKMITSNPIKMSEEFLMKIIPGTYLSLLPYELIDLILKKVNQIDEYTEIEFYHNYFDSKDCIIEILRTLRITNRQRSFLKEKPELLQIGTHSIMTDIGPVLGRKIRSVNSASICYYDMCNIIETGVKSINGLKKLHNTLIKWLVWICDHSNQESWSILFRVIISKIYSFNESLDDMINNYSFNNFGNELKEVKDIVTNIKYFIDYYLPYRLISRSDNYYCIRFEKEISLDSYKQCMLDLYNVTDIHPNDIDIQKAYDYELKTYSPDYFYNVYSKYTSLRNGKKLIPKGERPRFYWCGDSYIKSFV